MPEPRVHRIGRATAPPRAERDATTPNDMLLVGRVGHAHSLDTGLPRAACPNHILIRNGRTGADGAVHCTAARAGRKRTRRAGLRFWRPRLVQSGGRIATAPRSHSRSRKVWRRIVAAGLLRAPDRTEGRAGLKVRHGTKRRAGPVLSEATLRRGSRARRDGKCSLPALGCRPLPRPMRPSSVIALSMWNMTPVCRAGQMETMEDRDVEQVVDRQAA